MEAEPLDVRELIHTIWELRQASLYMNDAVPNFFAPIVSKCDLLPARTRSAIIRRPARYRWCAMNVFSIFVCVVERIVYARCEVARFEMATDRDPHGAWLLAGSTRGL